jgi:hypothetical protein
VTGDEAAVIAVTAVSLVTSVVNILAARRWRREAKAQQERAERLHDRARGWQRYAQSLEWRNDDEVIRRNTDHWMSDDGRAQLDERFNQLVSGLGGES